MHERRDPETREAPPGKQATMTRLTELSHGGG